MYSIALCDDEMNELDKSEAMLASYQKIHPECKFLVERFDTTQKLLNKISEQDYAPDLILLDIYMPEKTGMHAAKELRNMGNNGKIIFLTSSCDHALEAFGVDASQYLVKPVAERRLFPVLDKFLKEIEEKRQKYLLLRIDGRICRLSLDNIVCCEAQGKRQSLHLADGTQSVLRMTIAELYHMLSPYEEFVKVGASYIVNLSHIESLNSHDVCLDNGQFIFLPRGAYQPLREKYFQYYCD